MKLLPKDIIMLRPSQPRGVTLVGLASFHAAFNPKAQWAGVTASSTTSKAAKPEKTGKAILKTRSETDLTYSHGHDKKSVVCDLEDVTTPKEVFSDVENLGIEDVALQQTITVRSASGYKSEVSDFLENFGIERFITVDQTHGYRRQMLGIGCVSPVTIVGSNIHDYDPKGMYPVKRLLKRNRGVLNQDAILVDDGRRIQNICALKPKYSMYKMLLESWSKPFYMDTILPRQIVVTDNNITGTLFWLNKYNGPLGCR